MTTSIEWAQNPDGSKGETWNPTRGCTKISPGCKHCYAETFAKRWIGIEGHAYQLGLMPRLVPDALDKPLHWKKPRGIFVNSMSKKSTPYLEAKVARDAANVAAAAARDAAAAAWNAYLAAAPVSK